MLHCIEPHGMSGMIGRIGSAGLLALACLLPGSEAFAQAKPFAGVTLSLASQNDQFAPVLAKLAPQFEALTGATVRVDIMDYGTLLTKTTADFVGHTKGYDLVTMDVVWSGAYAENGYTVDLADWIKRDAAEIQVPDIYPVLMASLGGYGAKQVAFPFAGYANVLAYRKDLYAAAKLDPPKTMEDLVADAKILTDAKTGIFGFVANGKTGPAGAQDWMQYNSQMGGSILGPDGKPAIDSAANVASLTVYKALFDKAAPPGAANYDWDGREQSFRNGSVANMETWSVGAPGYYDPKQSKVVDTVAIEVAPSAAGQPPRYGVGGWGLAINADIDARRKDAAWAFIKWITSPAVHKAFNLEDAGSFLRRSEMTDKDLLAKFPFLPVIATTFEHGNGDYRPRIPQYPEIQDLLGTAVNAVLVGNADPKAALDDVQARAEKLF